MEGSCRVLCKDMRWWTIEWLEHLNINEWNPESLRLNRVDDIIVSPGQFIAKVYANRSRPHHVRIECNPWNDVEWITALGLLSSEAGHIAALVNGELTDDLLNRFAEAQLELFPGPNEWEASCDCTQEVQRCEHIHAAYRAFCPRLNDDPLCLFEFRGLDRTKLTNKLRILRSQKTTEVSSIAKNQIHSDAHSLLLQEQPDVGLFSESDQPDFWTKDKTLQQTLQPVYDKVRQQAMELLKHRQKKRGTHK